MEELLTLQTLFSSEGDVREILRFIFQLEETSILRIILRDGEPVRKSPPGTGDFQIMQTPPCQATILRKCDSYLPIVGRSLQAYFL